MREEKGSALLLVLFMLVIFTLLGIAVIGASVGGAQRSMTREKDVQSLHLAEMALNEAVARIAVYFDGKDDINEEQLLDYIEEIKSDINGEAAKVNSGIENAVGTIESIEPDDGEASSSGYGMDYTITIKAKAEVDGVTRILEQQVELNSYPEFLKYAFGSEGNIYINGAPYFIGSIYSGKHLYIKNEADYIYEGNPLKSKAPYPTVTGGQAYVQSEHNIVYCDRITSSKECENGNTEAYGDVDWDRSGNGKTIEEVLGLPATGIEIRDKKKFVEVNVEESFLDKLAEASGALNQERSGFLRLLEEEDKKALESGELTEAEEHALLQKIKGRANAQIANLLNKEGTTLFPLRKMEDPTDEDTEEYVQEYNDNKALLSEIFSSQSLNRSYVYQGNLIVDGSTYEGIYYRKGSTPMDDGKNYKETINGSQRSNWFIVDGDLTIGQPVPEGSVTPEQEIRGNILVTGDLTINGNVKMDATIFALGQTTVEDASIGGLDGKELVLIGKGPILINRVDAFNTIVNPYGDNNNSQDPALLEAFFYTDSSAELYGVGSAFWIKGGFFSKGDMTINAVLGNTGKLESRLNTDGLNEDYYPLTDDNRRKSRFLIHYNSEVYAHQEVGLPRVKQINITVGKKRFAK